MDEKVEVVETKGALMIGVWTKRAGVHIVKNPRMISVQTIEGKEQIVFIPIPGRPKEMEIFSTIEAKYTPEQAMIDYYHEVVSGISIMRRPIVDPSGQPMQ